MNTRANLIAAIRNNPKAVRFADACKIARQLGFTVRKNSGSSHTVFARPGEQTLLNFQRRKGGLIPPYQANQLIDMIDKYEDEL